MVRSFYSEDLGLVGVLFEDEDEDTPPWLERTPFPLQAVEDAEALAAIELGGTPPVQALTILPSGRWGCW